MDNEQGKLEPIKIVVVGAGGKSGVRFLDIEARLSPGKYDVVFVESIEDASEKMPDLALMFEKQDVRPLPVHHFKESVWSFGRTGKGERKRNKADRWR